MTDKQLVERHIRLVQDYPKPGVAYRDIAPLTNSNDFKNCIDLIEAELQEYKEQVDAFVSIDARGFIFAAPLADRWNKRLILARKKHKLPGETVFEEFSLEYGTAEMYIQVDALNSNDRVIVIDDLVATGGTLQAAVRLSQRMGSTVLAACCLIDLAYLNGAKLIEDQGVPVKSIFRYTEADSDKRG